LKRLFPAFICLLAGASLFLGLTLAGCGQKTTTTAPTAAPTTSGSTLPPTPTLSPTPSSTPTPTPTPTPSPTPTPTPPPPPFETLVSMVPDLPCYAEPDVAKPIVNWIGYKERVQKVRDYEQDGFAKILIAGSHYGYCKLEYLCSPSARIYAETIEGQFTAGLPGAEPTLFKIKLVDVRRYAPAIQVYQIFATDKNVTGVRLYERDICLLQETTLQKLIKAQEMFAIDGYTIKLYDGYRPYRVTNYLSAFNKNPIYLASSATGSKHNRGAAVDMTLIDKNGVELEMPSLVHTLNKTASRSSLEMTEAARRNMDYMSAVMVACGFTTYEHEWWHFNDADYPRYPVLDIDLGSIRVFATSKKPSATPPPIVDPVKSGFSPLAPTPTPPPSPSPLPTPLPGETTGETTPTT
jgi:D-alanyl-D-alanine dipeptidase